MSLGSRSRHILARARRTSDGYVIINDREPFRFREDARNRFHRVVAGDTLHTLAEEHFSGLSDSADLWWVIADYQDPPITDPTVKLSPGSIVVIPPEETIYEIFEEARQDKEILAER